VGAQYLKISVDGKSRDYLLNVPDPYDTNKPLAVVFAFHGSGGTKDGSGSGELIHAPNAAQDAIFVSPQGLNYSYGGVNYGVGWDEDCTGIDVKLVDAIIQQLSSSFCIASNRIFATGYSWGADFSNALGCCRGNVIRAVAPASGAEWGDVLGFNLDCGTRPLPAFRITYGDKDDGYTQTAFSNLIKVYRTGNHCQTSSVAITPSPCVSYQGCDHQVIECKYAGMGHVAPPNWGVDTWSFFASFQ
jgi:poly(3-hydroxybutyrate) depolymerase